MTTSNSPIDTILADYFLALETGEDEGIETICNRHPEHADEIQGFFNLQSSIFKSLENLDPPSKIEIEGFEILREIGRGGMGIVFEAIQTNLNRHVAIKVLKEGALASPGAKARFKEEAKLIAHFQNDHIVDVIQSGQVNDRPFLVMPLIRGRSLNRVIETGPLSQDVVAKLMLQVTKAISAAHAIGVIHRDIKPANILADNEFRDCKVADFGLAFWDQAAERMTQTGDVIGTPGYLAPEIIAGKSKGDQLTDIYSLGATMYALLTGLPPFRAATPAESLVLAIAGDPIAPRKLITTLAVDIESICLKCMHPSRDKRYSSTAELESDLQRLVEGKPVLARPVGQVETFVRWSRRNRELATALIVSFVLLIGLVGVGSYSYFQINKANKDLEIAFEKQAELTESANTSLTGSIAAIEDFFNKVGSSKTLADTQATLELKQDLLNDGIVFLNDFLSQNRGNPNLQFQIGRSYNLLAKLQARMGNEEGRSQSAAMAVETLEAVYQAETDDYSVAHGYASALLNSALFDLRAKGFDSVKPLLEKAIEVSGPVVAAIEAKKHDRPEDGYVHFFARMSLSRKLYDAGKREKAVADAIPAVSEFQRFVDRYPQNAELQSNAANLFNYLGILHDKMGKPTLARQQYELTCDFARRALANKPNDDDSLERLSHGLGNVGLAIQNSRKVSGEQLSETDKEKIRSLKLESMRIGKLLMERHPANLTYRLAYIEAVNNHGIALVSFDLEEAKPYLKSAAESIEQELVLHPLDSDPDDWLKVARLKRANLKAFASVQQIGGDHEQSLMSILEFNELVKTIWSKGPVEEDRGEHFNGLFEFGQEFQAKGRINEACRTYASAFDLYRKTLAFESALILSSRLGWVLDPKRESIISGQVWPIEFEVALRNSYLEVESKVSEFEAAGLSTKELLRLQKVFRQRLDLADKLNLIDEK